MDDDEVISIWNQCWAAMFCSTMTIGPTFLAITLMSYTGGKITSSQSVASIGVIYLYLYLVIMGSYLVAILPFILISRIFTSLVTAPGSSAAHDKNTVHHIRLLMLIMMCVGMAIYNSF